MYYTKTVNKIYLTFYVTGIFHRLSREKGVRFVLNGFVMKQLYVLIVKEICQEENLSTITKSSFVMNQIYLVFT